MKKSTWCNIVKVDTLIHIEWLTTGGSATKIVNLTADEFKQLKQSIKEDES